jgi:hypothetical protein
MLTLQRLAATLVFSCFAIFESSSQPKKKILLQSLSSLMIAVFTEECEMDVRF